MTARPISGIDDESMAHPASAFVVPREIRFGSDRDALEARLLLAGYADLLRDAVKGDAPVQAIREVVARITEITTKAVAAEIRKATAGETRQ